MPFVHEHLHDGSFRGVDCEMGPADALFPEFEGQRGGGPVLLRPEYVDIVFGRLQNAGTGHFEGIRDDHVEIILCRRSHLMSIDSVSFQTGISYSSSIGTFRRLIWEWFGSPNIS